MTKYFRGCFTKSEAKNRYRDLVKKHHPDNGGDAKILAEINAEFERIYATFPDSESANNENAKEAKKTTDIPHKFMHIITELAQFDIEIEIVGTWLWLHGNTYQYREQLKALGCRWSKGKKLWYWCEEPYHKRSSKYSMSHIRMMYGSEMVDAKQAKRERLA